MSGTVCIAYPTIMDGLVLRWYASEDAYLRGDRELASASRNCCMIEPECSLEVNRLADQAHSYLAVEYAASHFPALDVSRWVTHRKVGIFSRAIEPSRSPRGGTPSER